METLVEMQADEIVSCRCSFFLKSRHKCVIFLGETSEEEEEIRGGTGGGDRGPVGDGHSSRDRAHL